MGLEIIKNKTLAGLAVFCVLGILIGFSIPKNVNAAQVTYQAHIANDGWLELSRKGFCVTFNILYIVCYNTYYTIYWPVVEICIPFRLSSG